MIFSTSYYVKQMFATNMGTNVVDITADADAGPVFWSANVDNDTYIVKLANYQDVEETVSVSIPGKTSGTFTAIAANADDANTPDNPDTVPAPVSTDSTADENGYFQLNLGTYGVGVLVTNS
jgi:alpha-L-arabinofuranosidase